MELVIDANIIAGLYKVSVLEQVSPLTDDAQVLCDRLGITDRVFLDDSGHIENEWRSLVEPEWFEAWYGNLLISGAAMLIPVDNCPDLRKQLESHGFPRSKDFWYLRTAVAVVEDYGRVYLITEDVDFFDPTEKAAPSNRRMKILHTSAGIIAKHLRKKTNIHVRCVYAYLETITPE